MKLKNLGSYFIVLLLMVSFVFAGTGVEVYAAESITINSTTLTYDNIHYVDATNGDNTTGNGSENSPYATLDKALSIVENGDAIKLKAGEYVIDSLTELVIDKEYALIGSKQGTTIYLNGNNFNYGVISTKKAKIINLVFKPGSNFESSDARTYMYWTSTAVPNIDFYNCVFERNGDYPTVEFIAWGNNSSGYNTDKKSNFYNCVIEAETLTPLDQNGAGVSFVNCATLNDNAMYNLDNFVTSLTSVAIDSDYNITSDGWQNIGTGANPDGTQASIGVYGGEFAWDEYEILESPTNLIATTGDSKVVLSWEEVADADSYNVYRSTTSGGTYTTVAEEVYETSYTDTDVTNGTTYYYVVTAVNTDGESDNSDEASATPISSSNGNKALLRITMINGSINEYDITMDEVDTFIDWYEDRGEGNGDSYYVFSKDYNVGPFVSRTDYVAYDKILQFEVMEYTE